MLASLFYLNADGVYIFLLSLLVLVFFAFAVLSGWVASEIGKSFRFWFWLSIPLPVIALCILLCLPEKKGKLTIIDSGELFNHLFESGDINKTLN
jgi:hypothetical protein